MDNNFYEQFAQELSPHYRIADGEPCPKNFQAEMDCLFLTRLLYQVGAGFRFFDCGEIAVELPHGLPAWIGELYARRPKAFEAFVLCELLREINGGEPPKWETEPAEFLNAAECRRSHVSLNAPRFDERELHLEGMTMKEEQQRQMAVATCVSVVTGLQWMQAETLAVITAAVGNALQSLVNAIEEPITAKHQRWQDARMRKLAQRIAEVRRCRPKTDRVC